MAKATICDKCGSVLKYACDCKVTIYTHPYGDTTYELCNECKNELLKWLNCNNEFLKCIREGGNTNG